MKKFKRRPHVELLEICGEYLLVATEDARDVCPYVSQINASAAEFWKLLDGWQSVNEFVELIVQATGKEAKQVLLPVLAFLGKMEKSGYLLEEEVE